MFNFNPFTSSAWNGSFVVTTSRKIFIIKGLRNANIIFVVAKYLLKGRRLAINRKEYTHSNINGIYQPPSNGSNTFGSFMAYYCRRLVSFPGKVNLTQITGRLWLPLNVNVEHVVMNNIWNDCKIEPYVHSKFLCLFVKQCPRLRRTWFKVCLYTRHHFNLCHFKQLPALNKFICTYLAYNKH